jgi:hypothetical protein
MRDFRLCKHTSKYTKIYILEVFSFYKAKAFLIYFQNLAIVLPMTIFHQKGEMCNRKFMFHFSFWQNFAQKNMTGLDSKFVA